MLTRFFYCYNDRVENRALLCHSRSNEKENIGSLIFVLRSCIRFQAPIISHSLVSEAPLNVLTDGRTANAIRIRPRPSPPPTSTSLKLGACAKYQDHSSSGFLSIVLTRLSHRNKGKFERGITPLLFYRISSELIKSSKHGSQIVGKLSGFYFMRFSRYCSCHA